MIFGQLYKCDSIYHNENYTVWESYKNGLKHGAWEYRSEKDPEKILKYEEYWFGELVRTDTTNIYRSPMFDLTDSIIVYSFGPTVTFVIEKMLIIEPEKYYFCELSINNENNTQLEFYKKEITQKPDKIDKLCKITNRRIILKNLQIPIITDYDRNFAHLGWTRDFEFEIILNSKDLILEINQ